MKKINQILLKIFQNNIKMLHQESLKICNLRKMLVFKKMDKKTVKV